MGGRMTMSCIAGKGHDHGKSFHILKGRLVGRNPKYRLKKVEEVTVESIKIQDSFKIGTF